MIVSMMSEDEELICAALLHDVVEDAGVSEQQLEALFGPRVAALVMAETEDKTKSWNCLLYTSTAGGWRPRV